jgi:DNA-binding GntR family transcriptional regulator
MVHVPSKKEVDQLLAARAAIESESARLASRHSTKQRVADLREICRTGMASVDAGDFDEAVRLNAELHSSVTAMSGNKFLIQFAAQVDQRVRWYYRPLAQARGRAAWREHLRLVNAIADGAEDRAANIMREHTEFTRQAYHQSQLRGETGRRGELLDPPGLALQQDDATPDPSDSATSTDPYLR